MYGLTAKSDDPTLNTYIDELIQIIQYICICAYKKNFCLNAEGGMEIQILNCARSKLTALDKNYVQTDLYILFNSVAEKAVLNSPNMQQGRGAILLVTYITAFFILESLKRAPLKRLSSYESMFWPVGRYRLWQNLVNKVL